MKPKSIVAIIFFVGTTTMTLLFGCTNPEVRETSKLSEDGGIHESGIGGRVMSKSDVQTIPDSPFQALVLAIPSNKFALLLGETGITKESPGGLRRLSFRLPQDLFEKYVVVHTTSQQDGIYELQVSPGSYLLCVGNLDTAQRSKMLPAHVYGCIEVTVPEGKQLKQNIFWGLGGVTSR